VINTVKCCLFTSTDVKLSPWSDEADENGQRTRTIYYTLSVNYGFGPKSSPSVETQACTVQIYAFGTLINTFIRQNDREHR